MPRKQITDKQKEKAWKLYNNDNSISYIARTIGVSYASAWIITEGRKRGFKNRSEYQEHLAQQRGFKSYREYQEHLGKKRQKKELNTKLSILINLRLKELGKSQKWLANELNITESATSRYVSGKTTPKRSLQEKLFRILRFPYNTLDDLLED